jgi:prepilin-type N-terminal cleavage/methylation domain-containing protein
MRRSSGFTLIEISVVVVVLAMMAALAVPNLVSLKRSRAAADARAALVRLPLRAREEARKGKTTVALRIDGDALVLERTPPEEDPTEIARFSAPELRLSADSDWRWTVHADGSASQKTLTVQEGNRERTLVLPAEGSPRWQEADDESDADERWSAGELEVRE